MSYENKAIVDGNLAGVPTRGTDLVTILEADITVEKTSSTMVWIGGEIVFTITVVNNEQTPFTDTVITDDLNEFLVIAALDETSLSLKIGDDPAATPTYSYTAGVLTVTVGEVPAETQAVLTFRLTEI